MPIDPCVPKVENNQSHKRFVNAVSPNTVLMDIISARQLVKRGETADSYFTAATDVITTTTVPDDKLEMIQWKDEEEIVRQFKPAYHIPTDYSIYKNEPRDKRVKKIKECMTGTRYFVTALADTNTQIIPLIKGFSQTERQICRETITNIQPEYVAFYGTQYFLQSLGISQLVDDLNYATQNIDTDIFLIGLLSPGYTEKLPQQVAATSGLNQWKTRVKPGVKSPDEMRTQYEGLSSAIEKALQKSPDSAITTIDDN